MNDGGFLWMQYAPALNPPGDVHRLDHSFSFDFKKKPLIYNIFSLIHKY